jgi:hypothetical protein
MTPEEETAFMKECKTNKELKEEAIMTKDRQNFLFKQEKRKTSLFL